MENVTGQISVKEQLQNLINSGKIPHALLFSGPSGVGKDCMALVFAKQVNKKILPADKYEKIAKAISCFNEPYLKLIFPLPRGKNENEESSPLEKLSADEIQLINEEVRKKTENPYYKISIPKANNIKINSIREIKKFISLNYDDVAYRFIIITDADLMNDTSQNALLKSLEEPPEGVVFILTTSNVVRLRETILSRCWRINFPPLSNEEVAEVLVSRFNEDKNYAKSVSAFSNGSVTEALELIEHDFKQLLEKTILFLRYSLGKKYHSALKEINAINDIAGVHSLKLVIKLIIYWFNDFEKLRCSQKEDYYFTEYQETFKRFYNRYPKIQTMQLINNLENIAVLTDQNVNLNTIILNILFELSGIIKA